jgi:exopolyphosphatase / guanosine-5'-triphosphate,3'-diphosphate pyrophosphatase
VSVVAVVDIGTNSTRLLVAEVDGAVRELDRRTIVTRLGEGVDRTGRLGAEPQARVFRALDTYREAIAGAQVRTAVLTSAVRDAANGPRFAARVAREYGLEARTLSGEEEAQLTYRGATLLRDDHEPLLVIDVGGGSTELVVGTRGEVEFHASTQNGVVRHSERHLHHDPPTADELAALAADVEVPTAPAKAAVAVAGTATSCAAIDLALEPYDASRVEGHVLSVERLRAILARLAALPLARRIEVPGLHPDRASVIVAGIVILVRVLEAYDLDRVEVSERDILWGVALASTSRG